MNVLDRAKYRGKRTYNGRWIKGHLNVFEDRVVISVHKVVNEDIGQAENIQSEVVVIPETVGQFTGMKDKNGTEIFEGDICRFTDCSDVSTESGYDFEEYANIGRVYFCDESLGWDITKREQDREDVFFPSDMVVIGNIHDNPELLEAK